MLSILREVVSKGVANVFGESNSKKSYGGANGTCKHKRMVPPPEFTGVAVITKGWKIELETAPTSHTKEVHLSGILNSTKIGITYAIWRALTRWIPTTMEATKTSFHTEIGSAGVEPDSVGEPRAIEEEGM